MTRHSSRVALTATLAVLLVSGLASLQAPAQTAPGADDTDTDYGRMILVLDSSGSMKEPAADGTTKIAAAKSALNTVVARLPSQADVGLRVYGAEVFSKTRAPKAACTDSRLVVPPGVGNRDDLRRAINAYRPYGETPIAHALREAAKDIGSEGTRSIVLVSDGEATCAPDPCSVAAQIAAQGVDVQIDVVGLSLSGRARQQMQCIADKGNGTYYDADDAGDIADSITHATERALRPFAISGRPIEGGTTERNAPTITAGRWTDSLGSEDAGGGVRVYKFVRTMRRSTVHLSAYTQGDAGSWDQVEVTSYTPDGAQCSSGSGLRTIDDTTVISAAVAVGEDTPGSSVEDACWNQDVVYFRVERGAIGSDNAAAPFALTVVEEPPVSTAATMPPAHDQENYVAPRVTGAAQQAIGGSSFDSATTVSTGRYRGNIVPGEVQFFRVKLDWGQQLRVQTNFPSATPELYDYTGAQGPFATISLYNPLRAGLDGYADGTSQTGFSTGDSPDQISAISPEVRYLNREDYFDNTAYLAGEYFFAVGVEQDSDGETYLLPYTIDVEVVGEPTGQPTYVDGARPVGPGSPGQDDGEATPPEDSPETSPPAEDGRTDSGDASGSAATSDDGNGSGSDRTAQIVVASGLGAVGLAALGLALGLLRRRT